MEEQTWARFSTVETPKPLLTWCERGRAWARQATFRPSHVFCMAVLVAFSIVGANLMVLEKDRFDIVLSRARELKALDTSHNSIRAWIRGGRDDAQQHPRRDRGPQRAVLPGPGIRISAFHWTFPRADGSRVPPPKVRVRGETQRRRGQVLRLPVGVATTMMRQRLKQEERQGVDFQRAIDWKLLRTLDQQIRETAFYGESETQLMGHVQKLLRWANDAGVVTEVGPLSKSVTLKGRHSLACKEQYMKDDPQCMSAQILQEQLQRFSQEELEYKDVMRYPFLSALLYRGSFKELKFEGQGFMYWRNGKLAFDGLWHKGAMHGDGVLYDEDGSILWRGVFKDGLPVRTWAASYENLFTWVLTRSCTHDDSVSHVLARSLARSLVRSHARSLAVHGRCAKKLTARTHACTCMCMCAYTWTGGSFRRSLETHKKKTLAHVHSTQAVSSRP